MEGISDFYRGDTQTYNITMKDSAGLPLNISGGTIWFTMKLNASDTDVQAVIQKSVTEHIDAVNGLSRVVLSASDTDVLLPNTKYFYDFQYVDSFGNVKTILQGKVKILQDITLNR